MPFVSSIVGEDFSDDHLVLLFLSSATGRIIDVFCNSTLGMNLQYVHKYQRCWLLRHPLRAATLRPFFLWSYYFVTSTGVFWRKCLIISWLIVFLHVTKTIFHCFPLCSWRECKERQTDWLGQGKNGMGFLSFTVDRSFDRSIHSFRYPIFTPFVLVTR